MTQSKFLRVNKNDCLKRYTEVLRNVLVALVMFSLSDLRNENNNVGTLYLIGLATFVWWVQYNGRQAYFS